jgi:hypothetical protein
LIFSHPVSITFSPNATAPQRARQVPFMFISLIVVFFFCICL